MEDRVVTRIGSGFKPISEEELDVCVIAGMGGILITEILQEDINKAKKANKLILQPMNCIELVREWLYLNGFEITDEGLINEGFRIYNVIVAQWTGKIAKKELVYYYIGEKLIEKKDPLLKKYINRRIDLMDRVLKQMSAMKDQDSSLISDQRNIRNEISALLERINK
jgi:tRNA (adenine22-N1)-methyltransferase